MVAADMPAGTSSTAGTLVRIALAIQGMSALVLGLWASLAPRGFYDGFPGGGRHWVSIDGPFNEHLLRDFGGLNLALAAVSLIAAYVLTRTIVRTAGLAGLLFGVPHLLYHATHLSVFEGADGAINVTLLSGSAVLGALAIVLGSRLPEARPRVDGGR